MSTSQCSITRSAGSNKIATMNIRFCLLTVTMCVFILGGFVSEAFGQPESTPWGNLMGIRVDGEMMEFETSLRIVSPDWSEFIQSSRSRSRIDFSRDGNKLIINHNFNNVGRVDTIPHNLSFSEVIEDTGPGTAVIDVSLTAEADKTMAGTYFCIDLPGADYSGGTARLIDPASSANANVSLTASRTNGRNEYVKTSARGVRLVSANRQLEVTVDEPTEIVIRDDRREGNTNIQVYLAIISGNARKGQTARKIFTLKASGEIDRDPVQLTLDTSKPGRPFNGMGGNFRLQMPKTDPQVIDYCLENLNVAWGRIAMRWNAWQPEEDMDPIAAAKSGKLAESVHNTMEMARRLDEKDIPVIASIWFPPDWAISAGGPLAPHQLANRWPLNHDKIEKIYKSIGDYLVYLKEVYGVEAALFSFNESEKGVNVFQTPEEHRELIKTLGPYLVSRGLSTKMLLGDTSLVSDYWFYPSAVNDPETHKYIGAIGYHTWAGSTDENLAIWADTAYELNVPLIVTESSPDGGAHRYPNLFLEPWFQLREIDMYTRICAFSQPLSIMQWQFTADYSILTGGGVYNTEGPLRPTQRFWSIKQLGMTPVGSFALPISDNSPTVSCAAHGDISKGLYSVHIVNNGATRPVTLTGLPESVKELRMYITDYTRDMVEGARIPVANGRARFTLDKTAYTSLFSGQ